MNNFFDTICAPAAPLAKCGVGIIRISGENSLQIVQKIFSKKIMPGSINHGWIVENGSRIDEVIVLYFAAPKSFTGEDVVEIQAHGSPVVIREILNILISSGARLAQKGEFTKRAFLNGKMDLSEAEAVLELINSKSQKSASLNASNLSGALNIKIKSLKEKIIEIAAKITASIDFPEEVEDIPYKTIEDAVSTVKVEIENILKNASCHNILREGIKIAVTGRPNAGKSSLFNALLNLDRAIVTDIAGTTRDIISETFEINGIAATLIDTAGIRNNSNIDKVEKIGIDNAKAAIEDADIVLMLFDSQTGILDEDKEIFKLAQNKKTILIAAKADLAESDNKEALPVSSKTGENIDKLKELIYKETIGIDIDDYEFTTNQRQQESFKNALEFLNNALFGIQNKELQDLILIDIKSALISLDEITGEVVNDEILNGIFDKFCIGK